MNTSNQTGLVSLLAAIFLLPALATHAAGLARSDDPVSGSLISCVAKYKEQEVTVTKGGAESICQATERAVAALNDAIPNPGVTYGFPGCSFSQTKWQGDLNSVRANYRAYTNVVFSVDLTGFPHSDGWEYAEAELWIGYDEGKSDFYYLRPPQASRKTLITARLPVGCIATLDIGGFPGAPYVCNPTGISGYGLREGTPLDVWPVGKTADIQPDPDEECPGGVDDPSHVEGEPINVVSGSMTLDEKDILIPTPGVPLEFRRFYSSSREWNGALGPKWSHNYEWRLEEKETVYTNAAKVAYASRWLVLFTGSKDDLCCGQWKPLSSQAGSGAYALSGPVVWSYATNNLGSYDISFPAGEVYRFTTNGVLSEMWDGFGNIAILSYSNGPAGRLLKSVEHSNGLSLDFSYDSNRLVRVDSPVEALSLRFGYGAGGELTNATRMTSLWTNSTAYAYGASHVLTQRVDSVGEVRAWSYEGAKATHSVVGTNAWYDTDMDYSGSNTFVTVANRHRGDTDQAFRYEYHPAFRKVSAIYGPNNTNSILWRGTRYGFDDRGNVTNVLTADMGVAPVGQQYSSLMAKYNPYNEVTNWSFAYQGGSPMAWSMGWHTNWHALTRLTDPEGRVTEWGYTNGAVRAVRQYLSGTQYVQSTVGYTTNGLPSAVTNANGHWVRYGYDNYGYPTSVVPQAGPALRVAANPLGFVTNVAWPGEGGERETALDVEERGLVRSVVYPDGTTNRFRYDRHGDVTNAVDALGRTTAYSYLPTRKLQSVTRQLTGASNVTVTTALTYDKQFNTLTVVDPLGRKVEAYVLDDSDRPDSITNVESQRMTVAYALGDLVQSVKRFDGSTVAFGHDSGARVTQIELPGGDLDYTYLKNGLLKTAANAQGTVSNTWDNLNRLAAQTQAAPSGSVSYAYLPAGQVTNVTSVAGTAASAYDAAERLTERSTGEGAFRWAYNAYNGLVSSQGCAVAGVNVRYGYDAMDRITNVVWRKANGQELMALSYRHNAVGMVTNVAFGDGETVDYRYDSLDRLTAERRRSSEAGRSYETAYAYDLAGNRTGKTGDGFSVDCSLPYGTNGNRLASWTATSTNAFASLRRLAVCGESSEPIGTNAGLGALRVSGATNVTPAVSGSAFRAAAVPVGFGSQPVVAAIGDEAGNVGRATNTVQFGVVTNAQYAYSLAGCMTAIHYRGLSVTSDVALAWNDRYELTGVSTNGSTAERYGYDALGRRVYIAQGVTTNWLVYDGWQVVAEVDGAGHLRKSYTWGPGIDNLLAFTDYAGGQTNTYLALTDPLGTVHALAGADGAIVESYRYDAWGRVLGVFDGLGNERGQSAVGNRYLWQGREYSWRTGLYHFRARWYDPVTGRWLSNDPIGISGGLNQYVFCANNPVNFRDPWGLCEDDDGYLKRSWNQLIYGNLSDDVTLLGTLGQLGSGFLGIDLPGDVRDIAADFGGNAPGWQKALDMVGVLPLIGAVKNLDEAGGIVNNAVKRLSNGEINKLIDSGIHPHDIKPNSKYDLFKDAQGNIIVRPKSGAGPGDPTGININDL